MSLRLTFLGATERVTGSLYLIETDETSVLLECGLIQGSRKDERGNADPLPIEIAKIDAVILSHAHIDHSGRVPFLVKAGYGGPIYAQNATRALCDIMLPDSGYLNEKDAEWENKRRTAQDKPAVSPLYTRAEAEASLALFVGIPYREWQTLGPDLAFRYHDAGHILGSAIVEIEYRGGDQVQRIVFSGDLGYRDAPVMESPQLIERADAVILESTYGDRLHRPYEDTILELGEVLSSANASGGNVLIPAFAVGRTQDLLYLMSQHRRDWKMDRWHVFLDSPMAIEATRTYARFRHLYDAPLFAEGDERPLLPNYQATRTTEESMALNHVRAGAILIAGSGMCTGGRIHHHLKNNISRPECHLIVVGFQAYGTLGRRIVDGAETIKLWGEQYPVRAAVHTIGGLSAHADQQDLCDWYSGFKNRPPVYLVHGEPEPQRKLADVLRDRFQASVGIPKFAETIDLGLRAAASQAVR